MDLTQYAGSKSKYLKAADLNGRKVKVTINDVALVEFKNDDGDETKPCLSLAGKEKKIVCNATTVMSLGEAYGFNSDDWIGKEIGLSIKHYKSLGVDGLVVTPIGGVPVPKFEEDSIPF